MAMLEAYQARGWSLLPIPAGEKGPVIAGWQHLRVKPDELDQHFARLSNVGVLLGEPSGDLVDVDLDCDEARRLAPMLLPATGLRSGRASSPGSHWFYRASGGKTTRLQDPMGVPRQGRATLVEFRTTGAQTLIPPSHHPSGEQLRWEDAGEPMEIEAPSLLEAVRWVAAGAAIARAWPSEGQRHEASMALAGGLIRDGWGVAETQRFLAAVTSVAGDPEVDDRIRAVASTVATLDAERHATGWTRLASILDPRLVQQVRRWIGREPRTLEAPSPRRPIIASTSKPDSQATTILQLAREAGYAPFRDPDGNAFCDIPVDGHLEVWPIRSERFRHRLAQGYFDATGTVPGEQAIKDARAVLEGDALFRGPVIPVATRIAVDEDAIYLDLGNATREVVVITPAGWSVVPLATVPVRFQRPSGLQALPNPDPAGSIQAARSLLNVADDQDFILLMGWVMGMLYPQGARPVLQILGEQGSAKSSAAALLRSLIDPNEVPLRGAPQREDDLLIAARSSAVLCYDNLSRLPLWLSDAFCRLATGGGLSKRELYTDTDEVLLAAKRPVLLTGINEIATASDLLDRTITVTLPPIPAERRRTDRVVREAIVAAHPRILGALLNAAVIGLQRLPQIELVETPRMADFATWVEACAPGLGWEPGLFVDCYLANRYVGDQLAIEASPIGPALLQLMAERDRWEGSASDLLALLAARASSSVATGAGWPQQPNHLSALIQRLAPNLRAVGIALRKQRGGQGHRRIVLTWTETPVRQTLQWSSLVPVNGGADRACPECGLVVGPDDDRCPACADRDAASGGITR